MSKPNKTGKRALIVIDVQNDYFADGLFPQWEAERVLENSLTAIAHASAAGDEVILIQHIAANDAGPAPFFNPDTPGVELHPKLLAAVPAATRVVKQHADSFLNTRLHEVLLASGCTELLLCGMMTQNCVTHTALSPLASGYRMAVIPEACSSVSQMIHLIALRALSDRVPLLSLAAAWD